ncbi:TetR/AcrR family transcriptional regulator [Pontibacter sp. G13]|uniref:TetR/AcrR family transcriptional regulator n=1 Tax=Pontibacter sp. G13 TaxID=3074898 RepID=UPI00288A5C8D|nr:TetR/AcrR family transcriptional regulator [Pontibacter sp. G13]WNJ17182.1 TetR/AcrR family transcriptional regulator [Pontibacter sp. G13]
MKPAKPLILSHALALFNAEGVSGVPMRKIANAAGISPGNLTYHFPSREALIVALHSQMLQTAQQLNAELKQGPMTLERLLESMRIGFRVVYAYRFFLVDLPLIMRTYPKLRQHFREVADIRKQMYVQAFQQAHAEGWMREEAYSGEYDELIDRIRIFSDFWVVSAEVYEDEDESSTISRHLRLFMNLLFPYLHAAGQAEFDRLRPSI